MTLGELNDIIEFEAKAGGMKLGGYIRLLIREVLDSRTAQLRYEELYVPNHAVEMVLGQQTIDLPDEAQHLDENSIRFTDDGDIATSRVLYKQKFTGLNEGDARYFVRIRNAPNKISLYIHPYDSIVDGDTIYLNYWRKGSSLLTSDASLIIPEVLVGAVRDECVGRLKMQTGDKTGAANFNLSREMYKRSFGAVNLPDVNGN